MANRYVRIYTKPANLGEPGSILGFSMSASLGAEEFEAFDDYFTSQGRQIRELDYRNTKDQELMRMLGGVSAQYFEVQPPISDEQVSILGQLCASYIDPSHNSGFLIDNRDTPGPLAPFDPRGALVAQW